MSSFSSSSSSSSTSSSSSKSSAFSVEDFLADSPVTLLWRIIERQQNELQAGAHTDGQDIGHCGGGTCGTGAGGGTAAGQIDGYAMVGDMGHVAIPQGEGQGYEEAAQAGG